MSGCPEPLASVAGWLSGALGMLDQDVAETGRGSWGRDSELDDEPTLLHDSEPEERRHSRGGELAINSLVDGGNEAVVPLVSALYSALSRQQLMEKLVCVLRL